MTKKRTAQKTEKPIQPAQVHAARIIEVAAKVEAISSWSNIFEIFQISYRKSSDSYYLFCKNCQPQFSNTVTFDGTSWFCSTCPKQLHYQNNYVGLIAQQLKFAGTPTSVGTILKRIEDYLKIVEFENRVAAKAKAEQIAKYQAKYGVFQICT